MQCLSNMISRKIEFDHLHFLYSNQNQLYDEIGQGIDSKS